MSQNMLLMAEPAILPAFPIKLHKLFDSLTELVCALDAEGHFLYVNATCLKMWGYRVDELIGRNCFDLMVEEDRLASMKASEQLYATGEGFEFENRYYHRNGSIVTMLWVGSYDPEERILYVTGRDITRRKKSEEEAEMLSLLARKTSNSVIVTDADQRITWVNEAFTRLTGYLPDEVRGRRPSDLLQGPETDPAITVYMREQLLKQEPFTAEVLSYRKDGSTYWTSVSCVPVLDEQGRLKQFFSVETDITEKRQLHQEMEMLSLIAKETVNSVAVLNAERKVQWVNQSFTQTTGYTQEEVVGKKLSSMMAGPETDLWAIAEKEQQLIRGEFSDIEVLCYRKSGEPLWMVVQFQPLGNQRGDNYQYVLIGTDITERKKLKEDLDRETALRRQQITAAVIRAQEEERAEVGKELHDNVNQVLTTVKLYNELCLGRIDQSEELLKKSVQLLQGTINEIRSLSKRLSAPTLGNIRLKDSVHDLVEAISATNRLNIELNTSAIEQMEVAADLHIAVYRILQEHLTNVLKHAGAKLVEINFSLSSKTLFLTIADDGQGFDTRHKRKGIGITNMISRAESLGGYMRVISSPGEGCILKVSFPL